MSYLASVHKLRNWIPLEITEIAVAREQQQNAGTHRVINFDGLFSIVLKHYWQFC